jgi:hypothetical protein
VFPIAVVATFVAVVALVLAPFWGVLVTLALRPVIDTAWAHSMGGFNLLGIIGVAFPLLLLPRLLRGQERVGRNPLLAAVATALLVAYTFGSPQSLIRGNYTGFGENWMRALSTYVGFLVFAAYFRERRFFRFLLLALMIAGVFPLLMILFQQATGVVWQYRQTLGLVRKVGLYHDGMAPRLYGSQALAATALYLCCFKPNRKPVVVFLILYGCAWLCAIYSLFSKAAVVTLVAWWLTWCVLARRPNHLVLGIACLLILYLIAGSGVFDTVGIVFSKESSYLTGESDEVRRVLSGRGYIWEGIWASWKDLSPGLKLVGTGRFYATHNEWLRVLVHSGLIGLGALIGTSLVLGYVLLAKAWRTRAPIDIFALMVFEMWFIDCIGAHPGWYPAYQWFVWGLVGLSIQGMEPGEYVLSSYDLDAAWLGLDSNLSSIETPYPEGIVRSERPPEFP